MSITPCGTRLWPVVVLVLATVVLPGCLTHRHEAVRIAPRFHRDVPSIWPVDGAASQVTSMFGVRKDPFTKQRRQHNAVDITAPKGTPILATADGTVVCARRHRTYGRMIELDHGNGLETWYAHLHAIRTKEGRRVIQGQCIGTLGASGRVTGPNLHYEVHRNGKPVDPQEYLPDISRTRNAERGMRNTRPKT